MLIGKRRSTIGGEDGQGEIEAEISCGGPRIKENDEVRNGHCCRDDQGGQGCLFRDGESERAANAIEDKDLITVDLAIAEVGLLPGSGSFIFKRIESGHLSRFRKASGSSWKVRFILEACEVIKIPI